MPPTDRPLPTSRSVLQSGALWAGLLPPLLLLLLPIGLSSAFEAIPYVRIDFAYYHRLSQCQAKCSEQYAPPVYIPLLNGKGRFVANTTAQDYQMCELGCRHHTSFHPESADVRSSSHPHENSGGASKEEMAGVKVTAPQSERSEDKRDHHLRPFNDGQKFWRSSNDVESASQPARSSHRHKDHQLINALRPVCIEETEGLSDHYTKVTNSGHQNGGVDSVLPIIGSFRRSYRLMLAVDFHQPHDTSPSSSTKLLVQWRRAVLNRPAPSVATTRGEQKNDPEWITASIEPYGSLIRVDGLESSGWHYQFAVHPITIDGAVGGRFVGEWLEPSKLAEEAENFHRSSRLNFIPHYDSIDDGVTVRVRWERNGELGKGSSRLPPPAADRNNAKGQVAARIKRHRHQNRGRDRQQSQGDYSGVVAQLEIASRNHSKKATPPHLVNNHGHGPTGSSHKKEAGRLTKGSVLFPACRLSFEYGNSSSTTLRDIIAVDEGDGFLLSNLAFNSEYWLSIRPLLHRLSPPPFAPSESSPHTPTGSLDSATTAYPEEKSSGDRILAGRFVTPTCWRIHGAGNLECDPEPITQVELDSPNYENDTITVRWVPNAEQHDILLYQLYYVPVGDGEEETVGGEEHCGQPSASLFLAANATEATLPLPALSTVDSGGCEYELHLLNYDLLGREARFTKHFTYLPPQPSFSLLPSTLTHYLFTNTRLSSRSKEVISWVAGLMALLAVVTLLTLLYYMLVGKDRKRRKPAGREEHSRAIGSKRCNPPIESGRDADSEEGKMPRWRTWLKGRRFGSSGSATTKSSSLISAASTSATTATTIPRGLGASTTRANHGLPTAPAAFTSPGKKAMMSWTAAPQARQHWRGLDLGSAGSNTRPITFSAPIEL